MQIADDGSIAAGGCSGDRLKEVALGAACSSLGRVVVRPGVRRLENTERRPSPGCGPAVVAVEVLELSALPERQGARASFKAMTPAVVQWNVPVEEGSPLLVAHRRVGEDLELPREGLAQTVDHC